MLHGPTNIEFFFVVLNERKRASVTWIFNIALEVARNSCAPRCSRIKHTIFILLSNVVIRGKFHLRFPFESVYPCLTILLLYSFYIGCSESNVSVQVMWP